VDTRNRDDSILKRLAECIDCSAFKFWKLVTEEYSLVSESDLSWLGV
jgi:hypothetical protein